MQTQPKASAPRAWTLVVATAVISAALAVFFAPQFTQPIAARDAQRPLADAKLAVPPPSIDTTRIVPADVLGTGVMSWAPLTGDGSN